MDFRDPHRIGRILSLCHQRGPLRISGEHGIDQAALACRRFLGNFTDANTLLHLDDAAIRVHITGYQPEQGRFPGAVATDKAQFLDA